MSATGSSSAARSRSTARPTIRVWTENLRPHHKGRQLDLVTEASLDGEVVWLERSNYLRPGKGSGERPERGEEDRFAGAHAVAIWNVPGDVGRRLRRGVGRPQPDPHASAQRPPLRLPER